MTTFRTALVQLRTPAEQTAALAQAEPLIRRAAAGGAQLIATPEGSNLLQMDRPKMLATMKPLDQDPFVQGVRGLAAELKAWILVGSALVARPDGKAANRSLLIDDGGRIVGNYDKVHMFDVDLPNGDRYRESSLYEPGTEAALARTPWTTLGLTICYDVRFPYLHRALAQAGAEVLTVPAAFTAPTGEAHWEVLLRARAIETGAFVLAPAQGGLHEDGRTTWGRSMAVDPWGRILAKAEGDEPGVIFAEIDTAEVAKARRSIPSLANERVFAPPGFVGAAPVAP
jgi:predicted amidohydrolase